MDKTLIDSGLRDLETEVEAIAGVISGKSSSTLNGDLSYTVAVHVSSASITKKQATEVVDAVSHTFTGESFAKQQLSLDLLTQDGRGLTMYYFSWPAGEVAAEIDYWLAFQDAYGAPLDMGLGELGESGSGYRWIGTSSALAPSDWAALRAVQERSANASAIWSFPGLEIADTLPPQSVVDLFVSLEAVAPALGALPESIEHIQLAWFGKTNAVDVTLQSESLQPGIAFTDSESWPLVLSAIASVVRFASNTQFSYSGKSGAQGGVVHLSECPSEVFSTPGDAAFFAALMASGIQLPAMAAAGFCDRN